MKQLFKAMIAIAIVSAMLMSFASCGSSDSEAEAEVLTTEAAVYTESATPVANTSEEVLNYFNNIVNGVKDAKPTIYYRYEKNVPDDSLKVAKKGEENAEETDASLSALNKSAAGVKDMILKDIKEESGELMQGANNTEYLFVKGEPWASKLTVSDVDYAEIKEVGDNYYITIAFKEVAVNGDTKSLSKAFNLRNRDEILNSAEFAKTAAYLEFNDYDVAYADCKITATVNRLTDEVINLNYYKAATVTAHMTGTGTFEKYGDISVMFKLEDIANFDVNWESQFPVSPLETTTEA